MALNLLRYIAKDCASAFNTAKIGDAQAIAYNCYVGSYAVKANIVVKYVFWVCSKHVNHTCYWTIYGVSMNGQIGKTTSMVKTKCQSHFVIVPFFFCGQIGKSTSTWSMVQINLYVLKLYYWWNVFYCYKITSIQNIIYKLRRSNLEKANVFSMFLIYLIWNNKT